MQITKLGHSALLLDKDGTQLVMDPGTLTPEFELTGRVAAVTITHEHVDHWSPEHLQRILASNPDAVIYAPAAVAVAAASHGIDAHLVRPGDTAQAGPFRLEFLGGRHEVIHSSISPVENVAVRVDRHLVHPGDSYFIPEDGLAVELLAAPAGAPWLKVGEMMDWILALAPRAAFPIHEGTLSDFGLGLHHQRLQWAVEQGGGSYIPLAVGQTHTLAD